MGRGLVNGGLDAVIGSATADIAKHGLFDLGIAGLGVDLEQGCRRHDLPALAETALGDATVQPGLLHRLADRVAVQVVDAADALPRHGTDRGDAGTHRQSVDMHGAGTTQPHATAEFGPGITRHITDRPEQRHVLGDVQRMVLTVEFQGNHGHARIVQGYGVEPSAVECHGSTRGGSTQANRLSHEANASSGLSWDLFLRRWPAKGKPYSEKSLVYAGSL